MTIKEILQNATDEARKIAERLENTKEWGLDMEDCHCLMDDLLCHTIAQIGEASGCKDEAAALIEAYNSTDKWYA